MLVIKKRKLNEDPKMVNDILPVYGGDNEAAFAAYKVIKFKVLERKVIAISETNNFW